MEMTAIQITLARHMPLDTLRDCGIVREIIWRLVLTIFPVHLVMHDSVKGCSSPRTLGAGWGQSDA
jgi:hypothetical protein